MIVLTGGFPCLTDMEASDDDFLYAICIPNSFTCENRKLKFLLVLSLSSHAAGVSNVIVTYSKLGISSATYDWIGKVRWG